MSLFEDFPFYKFKLFDDKELLDSMFDYFMNIQWNSESYIIHGKKVTPNRKTFMYGRDYAYSGIQQEGKPFDKQIVYIAREIERKMDLDKGFFNACLLNLYIDGKSYISYHSDDEKDLDPNAPIVSVSLGTTRKFYLKNKETKIVEKLIHNNGEALVMDIGTQKDWTHSVPKETTITEPRISLTFRRII